MDREKLKYLAYMTRKRFGVDENSRIDIFAIALEQPTLTIVLYPMGDNISGALLKSEPSSVIAINSTMSKGRERFSLAHELYHLLYDDNMESGVVCSSIIGSSEQTEKDADAFASYLLIPEHALVERINTEKEKTGGKLTIESILAIEQFFGVSRRALLYRLLNMGVINKNEHNAFLENVRYYAMKYGYSIDLYEGQPEDMKMRTFGYYVKLADKLYEGEKISAGKYEEYLMDAFRDDIVYGVRDGDERVD